MAQNKPAPKHAQRSKHHSIKVTLNPANFHIPLWIALIVFTLTTLIFFRAQLFGDAYFWEDFTEYVYPAQSFAATYLQRGELPFWNPYSFSGMPFLADVAVGLFYPPNMALALVVENGKLPVLALECLIIAHFVLAQLTMFILARSLRLSDGASLLAAISFGFSGIMAHHVFHPMMVAHFAWFPLAFLHFRQALLTDEMKKRFLHSVVAGVVLGIMMLSGHPQTTLYLVLVLFFYTLWILATALRTLLQRPIRLVLTGLSAVLPIMIGAGLFAIQLLHSQEFSSYSERNAMTFERASMGSIQASQLLTAFVPKLFGAVSPPYSIDTSTPQFTLGGAEYYDYWEASFYVGIPALTLALFAFISGIRRRLLEGERLTLFFLVLCVFGALFALGSNGFVFPLFFKIPLFDRFRIPARMIALVSFSLAICAGIGFDEIWKHRTGGKSLSFLSLGIAFVLILGAAVVGSNQSAVIFALILLAITGFFLLGIAGISLSTGALCLLAFIDLYNAGSSFNANRAHPLSAYTEAEQRLAMFRTDYSKPDSLFRISVRERGIMLAPRNLGLVFPVMMYEGYAPLLVERRLPPAPTPDKTNDLINLRYQIALDNAQQQAYLKERPGVYPRARMVFRTVQESSDANALIRRAQSGTVDFDNEAILELPPHIALSGAQVADVEHSVRCTEYGANAMTYSIETSENGLLVLSEIWYPAWKATIDGVATDVLRVNYSLRGVLVPKGQHRVVLRYDSDAFRLGMWISLSTLIIVVPAILVLAFVSLPSVSRQRPGKKTPDTGALEEQF